MEHVRITFANDWPLSIVVAVLAVAVVLVAVAYWLGGRRLRPGELILLFVLRLAAVALIVLLLFRPTVHFTSRSIERGQLVVLIDDSISMGLKDGENMPSRLEWVKSALSGGLLDSLGRDFDLSLFAFSSSVRPVPPGQLGDVKAQGESTLLAQAVAAVADKADRARLAAALVFSDGIDNSGRDPIAPVTSYGVPLYTVGAGAQVEGDQDFRDLYIQEVRSPLYATVDNVADIKVAVGGVGYSGREVTVEMKEGTAVVASGRAVIQTGGTPALAELKFTPKKSGQYDYVAEVPADTQERVTENNRYTFSIIVTDPKVKVLYVEGVPRSEYKYLKRALEADPNTQVLSLIQVSKGRFLQQGHLDGLSLTGVPDAPEVLAKFNVIVLGDIDRTYFSDEQLTRMEEAVSNGAGLLVLGGRNSLGPGGYGGTPIEKLLPVSLGGRDAGQSNKAFTLQLTREGKAHAIFEGIEGFFVQGEAASGRPVPNLLGSTRVGALKAGAQALAENPGERGADRDFMPVLAVQSYGKGRSMVFAADTTWQWYSQLRPLGNDTPYVRFWGQAVRWLASQDLKKERTEAGLTVYTDKRFYQPGEPVKLRVLARDELGQAANRATVNVVVTLSGDNLAAPTSIQLPYLAGTAGEYAGEVTPSASGHFEVTATGTQDTAPLGQPVKTDFRVGKPNLEYERLGLNEELLRRLAELTGGRYYPLVQAEQIPAGLQKREFEKHVSRSYRLWNGPYFFFAFIAIVTAEWILRRRRQMP